MKKLFTLVTMMILLGVNRAWAGPYVYFNVCPQLDFGTTSYDFLSPELFVASWSQQTNHPFDSDWSPSIYGPISRDFFANAKVGDKIRVNGSNITYGNNNGKLNNEFAFKIASGDFQDIGSGYYANFNDNKTSATIEIDQTLLNYIQANGMRIQGHGFYMNSVEIVPEKSGFTWYAEPHGITITGGTTGNNGTRWTLDPSNSSNFSFTGTGYIIITCERDNMKASYMITVLKEGQKRYWDFTKHQLVIGPDRSVLSWRLANDGSWESHNYNQHNDNEWAFRYTGSINVTRTRDIIAETNGGVVNGDERILYINEGNYGESDYANNGYNKLSIRNGGDANVADHSINRFFAVEDNVTIKIPGLKQGDRVRMRIDKYGEILKLNFTNAQDAIGTLITGDYTVGGSSDTSNGKDEMKAYYNFIVDHDGDFTFKQTQSGILLRIYDIEVYTGDFIMSNEILSAQNEYTIVNPYGTENARDPQYGIHFRGKAESGLDLAWVLSTGTLNLTKSDFTISKTDPNTNSTGTQDNVYLKKSAIKDKFGAFKIRLHVKDASGNYVTDYADRTMSVGYYENVGHPYTWDFTDLERYSANLMAADYDNYHNHTVYNDGKTVLDDEEDMNNWMIWKGVRAFNFQRTGNPKGAPFAWGSQLYAYDQMIPEARGIAFTPLHMGNGSITLSTEGLKIDGGYNDTYSHDASAYGDVKGKSLGQGYGNDTPEKQWIWEIPWEAANDDHPAPYNYDSSKERDPRLGWKLTIYDLPNETAIYIRVKTIKDKTPKLTLDFKRTVEENGITAPNPRAPWNYFKRIIDNGDGTKDIIVGVSPTQSNTVQPFSFILNNVIVKRIATSKDLKYIGQTGHATESRFRTIDHTLDEFFTNEPIKAYQGKYNDDYSKLILKEVNIMKGATNDDEMGKGTVLIHSSGTDAGNGFTNKTVNVIDDGFHMFVPDMHDFPLSENVESGGAVIDERGSYTYDGPGADDVSENVLISKGYNQNVYAYIGKEKLTVVPISGTNTNLVLSAKRYTYGGDGTDKGNGYDVYFLRVDPSKAGATVPGYSAYIQIPTEKMRKLTSNNGGQAKMSIVFEDELFGEINNGIATGIEDANHLMDNGQWTMDNAVWRTIDGQKLNGMPTAKGLYIVNGKKVMVK